MGLVFMMVLLSLLLFVAMWQDKRLAINGEIRIPERTLFMLAVFGGAIGGTIGMYKFHHKTKHAKFVIGFPALAIAQIILLIFALFVF